jgi:hypothetical protein
MHTHTATDSPVGHHLSVHGVACSQARNADHYLFNGDERSPSDLAKYVEKGGFVQDTPQRQNTNTLDLPTEGQPPSVGDDALSCTPSAATGAEEAASAAQIDAEQQQLSQQQPSRQQQQQKQRNTHRPWRTAAVFAGGRMAIAPTPEVALPDAGSLYCVDLGGVTNVQSGLHLQWQEKDGVFVGAPVVTGPLHGQVGERGVGERARESERGRKGEWERQRERATEWAGKCCCAYCCRPGGSVPVESLQQCQALRALLMTLLWRLHGRS